MNQHASINRAYRLVWNESTQTWAAVAENAKGRGKRSVRSALAMLALASASFAAWPQGLPPPAPGQLPTGGNVVAGQAGIGQSGTRMDIQQSSQRAVIDWSTFNVGSQAHVHFNQPSAAAATLNRVMDTQASQIFGRITAPGQVFLTNPNGVYFSPTAQVDVGALVATTHSISNSNFMAGRLVFERNGATGSVVNEGQIRASLGGFVALLAPEVRNSGLVLARMGTVALAAGEAITLNVVGSGQVTGLTVTPSQVRALVDNRHIVQVDGGTVLMSAQAINALQGSVVNTGQVLAEATGLAERGGRIVLESSGDTYLAGSGRVSATSAQGQGGQVSMTGQRVALLGTSAIDASGATGGGSVRVGGDYQGQASDIANAQRAFVASGATIKADATGGLDGTAQGDGGRVIVWADGDTRFAGNISARGAAQGGNGGFVEVSGKRDLDVQGSVDVTAPKGTGGTVLFDPENITLSTAVNNPAAVTNQAAGTPDLAFAAAPNPGTYNVQISGVTGFNELFLQATNNITVANAVTMGTGNSVRLEANNSININAALAASGGVTLTSASGSVSSTAAGTISSTGAANANAGNVSITAGTSVNLLGAVTASGGTTTGAGRNGGTVTISGQTGVSTAAITASGTNGAAGNNAGGNAGSISITNATGGAIQTGALTASSGNATGTGTGGAAGSITVTNNAAGQGVSVGAITTTGGTKGAGGVINLSANGTLTLSGNLAASGGAGLASAGANAGNITLNAGALTWTAARTLTASGGAGNGTSQAGGAGGAISITSNGGMAGTGLISATASGGAATAANGNGGNAGSISITNNTAGGITTGALTASTGNATGTGLGGTAGSITVTNNAAGQNVSVGAITTTGGAKGAGGAISVTAAGAGVLSTGGAAIASTGGAGVGSAGANAGNISLVAGTLTLGASTITATGGAGNGAGFAGGNGGQISLTSNAGGMTSTGAGAVTANGGAGGTAPAAGGAAGSITVTNAAASTGNINLAGTGGLNARTGASTGTTAAGAAGSITVNNNATNASTTTTGAITTSGQANGQAGGVTISSVATGLVTVGAINAVGGAVNASSTLAGRAGGNVSLTSAGGITTGLINTSGSAGVGTDQNGGAAGSIGLTNATGGAIQTGALTAQTGGATGNGLGGTVGNVTVTNSATGQGLSTGAINTSGGAGGNGGNVTLTSAGGVTVTGTLNTNGTVLAAGTRAGSNAGNVTISGTNRSVTGAISASGSAANGTNQAGGNAGVVSITGAGTLNTVAITAGTGAATGTGAGGTTGGITLSGTTVTATNLSTAGAANGAGGAVSVTSTTGAISLGTVATGAGAAITGTDGRDAGNVTINSAAAISALGAITASGSAGVGTSQNGGAGGTVSITAVGGIAGAAAITASGGAAVGAGNGGNAGRAVVSNSGSGNVLLGALTVQTGNAPGAGNAGTFNATSSVDVRNTAAGGNVTTAAIITTGGTKAAGGNVILETTSTGTLSTGNAGITTSGGTAVNQAGRNAGNVTLTAGVINLGTGDITANGSNAAGTGGTGGVGGTVQLSSSGSLTVDAVTANGGSGVGANAQGGAAGSISVVNNSTSAGVVQTGALTARVGTGVGTAASPTVGTAVTVNNQGGNTTVAAIDTSGQARGNGGSVNLTSAGTLQTAAINTAPGAGMTARGNVDLLAGGPISQTGAITANLLTARTANAAGASITLTNAGNDATTVNLQARDGTVAAVGNNNANGAIAYNDTNAVAVSGINNGTAGTAGNVTLGAGGAVTQTGAIQANALSVRTNNATAGTGTITLTNAGNAVSAVNLQARNGTMAAPGAANINTAIQFGASGGYAISGINTATTGTAGNVTLTAGGTVSQSGVVNAAQLTATLSGATSALNLNTQANNIAQLNATTAPGGVAVTNGNNNLTVAGNISTTNNAISVDTGTGTLTQNAATVLNAGTGDITVTANTLTVNAVSNAMVTSGTLTLRPGAASRAATVGATAAGQFDLTAGELTAVSGGATGPIVIGRTDSTAAMTIGGAVNLAGKTLTLNAGSITDAGTQTITAQNLTLAANGQIGTNAANGIDVAVTNLSVNTGANGTASNASAFVRSGTVNLGVGAASGANVGTGTLDLQATGAVTQTTGTGNITAGTLATKTLNNAGSAVTLNNAGNAVGTVNLQARNAADTANAAGALQFASSAGYAVSGLQTTGNATLNAGGAVTQSGAVVAAGLALTGANGSFTLRNAGNAVTTLAANTGSVDFAQTGALAVGSTGGVNGVTTSGVAAIETTGAASNLTLNNAVTSTAATGTSVVLKAGSSNAAGTATGGQFVNSVGAGGISTQAGARYVVYSGDPGTTTEGLTGFSKRYNANASFTPAGASSFFVYRVAPVLNITANAGTQVYDGNLPNLSFTATGLIDGDTALQALTGSLVRAGGKNVLGGDAVTQGTLAASDMGYQINSFTGANFTITPRTLSITGTTAAGRAFDGTTNATLNVGTITGFVGSETVTASAVGTFDSRNAGNRVATAAYTLADGANGGLASNYALANTTGHAAVITPRVLTITGTTANGRVYDGTTNATLNLGTITGFVGTETVTASAVGTFDSRNAGNRVATAAYTLADGANGGLAGNYSLANTTGHAATITPATIARVNGITALNKVVDGNTAATLVTSGAQFVGMVAGDNLTIGRATGRFNDALVGSNKPVSITDITLSGVDAGNYVLAQTTATTTASILAPTAASGQAVADITGPVLAVLASAASGRSGFGSSFGTSEPGAVAVSPVTVSLSLVRPADGGPDVLMASVPSSAQGGFQFDIPARLPGLERATVTLEGGLPLPAWLSYDERERRFLARQPLPAGGALRLVVAAADGTRLPVVLRPSR